MEDLIMESEATLEAYAHFLLSPAFQSMQNGPSVAPLLTCELSGHLSRPFMPKFYKSAITYRMEYHSRESEAI
jgi:hypothetical protein